MIPSCNRNDIEHLLKFYAQKAVAPLFVTIDEMERKKLDVSEIAKKIYDEDMRRSEKNAYIQSLWAEEGSLLPVYYTNPYFFKKLIDLELDKLDGDIEIAAAEPQMLLLLQEMMTAAMYVPAAVKYFRHGSFCR